MVEIKSHPHLDILVGTDGTIYKKDNRKSKPTYELTQGETRKGYVRVYIDGKYYSVHRLVLETFVGPCPEGKTCDHINRIHNDNRLDNLRWVTASEQAFNSDTHDKRDKRITVSQTVDRNEYVRQYRSLHRDEYNAYMRNWYSRRKTLA